MFDYSMPLDSIVRPTVTKVNNVPTRDNLVTSPVKTNNVVGNVSSLPYIAPDYNVSVPVSYSKIGVERLNNGQEIHCYKLSNGQKVYIAPKESANTVLNTYVNTGSMNEKDDERGISHYCEHMAFNGTKGTENYLKVGKDGVREITDNMAGYTNASTSFAETKYTISIPQFEKGDFEKIVQLQASMMNNLEMADDMIKKEHGPVVSEINMYSDMPDVAIQNRSIKNLFNIKTTSEDLIAGTVDNILNIDRKKAMDYYTNNYYPANMTTVVTGDVNPDEAIEIIAKNFRGQNPQNPDRRMEKLEPIQKTVREDIFSDKAVGVTGALTFAGPAFTDYKDMVAIKVLNSYLFNKQNSVMDRTLQDYDVSVQSYFDKISTNKDAPSLLTVKYDSTEENSEVALRAIFEKLGNFQPPSYQDLDALKTSEIMALEKSHEYADDLNNMIGSYAFTGGIEGVTNEINIIKSLTPEDLSRVAKKYYDINKTSVAIMHPSSENIDSVSNNYQKAQSVTISTSDNNVLSNNYVKAPSLSFTGTQNQSVGDTKVRQPLDLSKINQYKLNNNANIAMFNSKNDISCYSMEIKAPVPPMVKPGVISLLSTMLLKSADKHSKFIDSNNINFSMESFDNAIVFSSEVPSKNLNASLNLMKELLDNPDFSVKSFEDAKREIKNTLSVSQPSAFENAKKETFNDSPRGYTNKDVLDNIDDIQLGDVIGLYQYIRENGFANCVACLPVDKYPESKSIFDNQIAGYQTFKQIDASPFNDFKPITRTKVVRDVASTAQADIVQMFKFYDDNSSKSRVTNHLVNSILFHGSETGLFNNLREKQKLAYDVHSSYNRSHNTASTLTCAILTTTDSPDYKAYDNVQKSIDGFNNQISKMVNGEFTDDELRIAKLKLKAGLLMRCDTQGDRVENVSESISTSSSGVAQLNEMYNLVDTITKEDIINASKNIFSQKPIYSIRASQDTLNANKEYLDMLEG